MKTTRRKKTNPLKWIACWSLGVTFLAGGCSAIDERLLISNGSAGTAGSSGGRAGANSAGAHHGGEQGDAGDVGDAGSPSAGAGGSSTNSAGTGGSSGSGAATGQGGRGGSAAANGGAGGASGSAGFAGRGGGAGASGANANGGAGAGAGAGGAGANGGAGASSAGAGGAGASSAGGAGAGGGAGASSTGAGGGTGASSAGAGGTSTCGNKIVDSGEQCDEGSSANESVAYAQLCSNTCTKVSTLACVDCENAGLCAESVNNCLGVDVPFNAAEQAQCFAVLSCIQKSNCFDGTGTLGTCYCGSLDTGPCGAAPFTGAGSPDGACVKEIKAGFPTYSNNQQVLGGLTATDFPSGAAMKRLNCQKTADGSACLTKCGLNTGGPAFP